MTTAATLTAHLRAAGLMPANVTCNRRTGTFAIRFDAPDATNFRTRGTDPARVWAERIAAALKVEIVDCYDSVCEWRPVWPVTAATIYVRVSEAKAA